jgi:hypothetical protein
VDPCHWSRVQRQPGTQTMIGRGTWQRWTIAPVGNMIGNRPAPLRPLGNMIGDGPALHDRPRAAVTSSTRLKDCSVLLERKCCCPVRLYSVWLIFQVQFTKHLLKQQTILRDRLFARPLLLSSYFKYILPCTAGTTDSLAQPFSCANVFLRKR